MRASIARRRPASISGGPTTDLNARIERAVGLELAVPMVNPVLRNRCRPLGRSEQFHPKPCGTGVSVASDARNPQFFAPEHEKTPNFRDESIVRAAPNRLFDEGH